MTTVSSFLIGDASDNSSAAMVGGEDPGHSLAMEDVEDVDVFNAVKLG